MFLYVITLQRSLYIYSKDELEEVDRELGYYLITKCPEEVKRKEFPIKF